MNRAQDLELGHLLASFPGEGPLTVRRKPLKSSSPSISSSAFISEDLAGIPTARDHHNLDLDYETAAGQAYRQEEHTDGEGSVNNEETPSTPAELRQKNQAVHHFKSTPTNPTSNSDSRSEPSFVQRLWIWEFAAPVFSLVCMACIVGVLAYEEGKRLDEWGLGQAFLSPTVVVSFLGTLGKSACLLVVTEIISQLKWLHFKNNAQRLIDLQMFDNASRGPWGAFQLAFRKNRKALLATCACLLVLASLLVGPFVQSVFQFPVILTLIQDVAPTILASRVYDPFSLRHKFRQCYGPEKVDSLMQAAILSPIWNATRAPSLPCGFERCGWPTITTLGVCSSCTDLTDTVVSNCHVNSSQVFKALDCNYTLPSRGTVFNAVLGLSGGAAVKVFYSTVWNSLAGDEWSTALTSASPMQENAEVEKPRAAVISNFTFVKFPQDIKFNDYINADDTYHAPPVAQAMQCKLQLCARTFIAPQYANFSASPLAGPQVTLVTSPETTITNDNGSILVALTTAGPDRHSAHTSFQINYCEYKDIALYLEDLFTTTTSNTGVASMNNDASTTGANERKTRRITITPALGLAFSQAEDISELMRGIADSMTEAFRTSPNSTTFEGKAMSSVIYIDIVWVRLALPISLVVLTFVMLVVVILRNHARGVPTWKSSSLALLFHELDGWERTERESRGPEDMEEVAGKMKARIVNKDGILSFSKAEFA